MYSQVDIACSEALEGVPMASANSALLYDQVSRPAFHFLQSIYEFLKKSRFCEY